MIEEFIERIDNSAEPFGIKQNSGSIFTHEKLVTSFEFWQYVSEAGALPESTLLRFFSSCSYRCCNIEQNIGASGVALVSSAFFDMAALLSVEVTFS
jgi:hypothetical protein